MHMLMPSSTLYDDVTLLISTNDGMGELNSSLTKNGTLSYQNSLISGQEANACIDTTKCNMLDGEGQAYYYIFKIVKFMVMDLQLIIIYSVLVRLHAWVVLCYQLHNVVKT